MRTIGWLVGVAALCVGLIAIVYVSFFFLPPVIAAPLLAGIFVWFCWAMIRGGKPYESEHGPQDLRRADDGYDGPNHETGAGWL